MRAGIMGNHIIIGLCDLTFIHNGCNRIPSLNSLYNLSYPLRHRSLYIDQFIYKPSSSPSLYTPSSPRIISFIRKQRHSSPSARHFSYYTIHTYNLSMISHTCLHHKRRAAASLQAQVAHSTRRHVYLSFTSRTGD